MNKILIIIPTYNESENILKIISDLNNLNENYHILVVDGNSEDNTINIVENIIIKNDNITLIKQIKKMVLEVLIVRDSNMLLKKTFQK